MKIQLFLFCVLLVVLNACKEKPTTQDFDLSATGDTLILRGPAVVCSLKGIESSEHVIKKNTTKSEIIKEFSNLRADLKDNNIHVLLGEFETVVVEYGEGQKEIFTLGGNSGYVLARNSEGLNYQLPDLNIDGIFSK